MKPFDAWSQMTRLGVALLLISATLFAFDVGGTFALERGSEKAGAAVAPVLEQPVATRVAVPVRVAQVAVPVTTPKNVIWTPAALRNVTPVRVATSAHVAARARVSAPRRVAVRQPMVKRIAVSPQKRKVLVAPATQPRRVAVVLRPVLPKAPLVRRVQARSPQQNVATLRDVRKYVMHVLASRYRGLSVMSAATYARDGGVVVNMVVHDRRREWFEKDVVHRAGTELSIQSERQRMMGTLRRRPLPNLPRSKLT
jgi:hypothetical protein